MALRTTEDSIVFACYSKSCAPPPVGKGGSVRGGGKGGRVIRKSGGGDSSVKAGTSKSIARAITNRYSTKDGMEVGKGTKLRPGSAPKNSRRGRYGATGNSKTTVSKNRAGGVGGSSVGRGPVVKLTHVPKGHVTNAMVRTAKEQAVKNRRPGDWRKYL